MAFQPSHPSGMRADSPTAVSPISPVLENSRNDGVHDVHDTHGGSRELFHSTSYISLKDPRRTHDNVSLRQEEKQLSPLAEVAYIAPYVPPPASGWEAGSISQRGTSIYGNRWRWSSLFSLSACSNTWIFEIASIAMATLTLSGMMILLARWDNEPLSAWSSPVTLNAAVAILVTTATASLSVPLSSGLGQLKWMRFKQGPAPLADMESFDGASRGPLGALILLLHARGGSIGSFGAFVVIITLLLSPFSQQIASYPTRDLELDGGATNYRAFSFDSIPILPIKSAVYYALSPGSKSPLFTLPVECPSGDCTFGEIETLGICSSCVDLTGYLTRRCSPSNSSASSATCSWVLPSGAILNASDVFSMTSSIPSPSASISTIAHLSLIGVDPKDDNALQPWATQCTLSACVQRLDSRVRDGVLEEELLASYTNTTASFPPEGASGLVITSPVTNRPFKLPLPSRASLQSALASLFQNGSISRAAGVPLSGEFPASDVPQAFYQAYLRPEPNTHSGPSTPSPSSPSPTPPLSPTPPSPPTETIRLPAPVPPSPSAASKRSTDTNTNNIDFLLVALSTALTTTLRSANADTITGTTTTHEPYIKIRWGYTAVPVLCLIMTGIFLVLAAWETTRDEETELWKGSVLPVLFHGLDNTARAAFGEERTLLEKRKEAKHVRVRLEGGRLIVDGDGDGDVGGA